MTWPRIGSPASWCRPPPPRGSPIPISRCATRHAAEAGRQGVTELDRLAEGGRRAMTEPDHLAEAGHRPMTERDRLAEAVEPRAAVEPMTMEDIDGLVAEHIGLDYRRTAAGAPPEVISIAYRVVREALRTRPDMPRVPPGFGSTSWPDTWLSRSPTRVVTRRPLTSGRATGWPDCAPPCIPSAARSRQGQRTAPCRQSSRTAAGRAGRRPPGPVHSCATSELCAATAETSHEGGDRGAGHGHGEADC